MHPTRAAIVHFNLDDFDTTTDAGRAHAFDIFCLALDSAQEALTQKDELTQEDNAAHMVDCPPTTLGVMRTQEAHDRARADAPAFLKRPQSNTPAKIERANRALKGRPEVPADVLAVGPVLQLVYPSHAARDPRDAAHALTLSHDARAAALAWSDIPDREPVFTFQDAHDDWSATRSNDGDIFLYGHRTGIYLRSTARARQRNPRACWLVMMTHR
jgi:hypothetical protein